MLATTLCSTRVMAESLFDPSASRLTPGEIGSALSGEIKSLPIVTGYYGARVHRGEASAMSEAALRLAGDEDLSTFDSITFEASSSSNDENPFAALFAGPRTSVEQIDRGLRALLGVVRRVGLPSEHLSSSSKSQRLLSQFLQSAAGGAFLDEQARLVAAVDALAEDTPKGDVLWLGIRSITLLNRERGPAAVQALNGGSGAVALGQDELQPMMDIVLAHATPGRAFTVQRALSELDDDYLLEHPDAYNALAQWEMGVRTLKLIGHEAWRRLRLEHSFWRAMAKLPEGVALHLDADEAKPAAVAEAKPAAVAEEAARPSEASSALPRGERLLERSDVRGFLARAQSNEERIWQECVVGAQDGTFRTQANGGGYCAALDAMVEQLFEGAVSRMDAQEALESWCGEDSATAETAPVDGRAPEELMRRESTHEASSTWA